MSADETIENTEVAEGRTSGSETPVGPVWEERWHPLREEWVVIAAHRQNRPWSGETVAHEVKRTPRFVEYEEQIWRLISNQLTSVGPNAGGPGGA